MEERLTAAAAELESLAERAETLYRDLDFGAARAWKQETAGRRVIGFLPVYAPEELIHAAGMLPVAVRGGGADLEIIRGDAYFQSYICHLPRSVVELGVSGRMDVLDGMLFPSTCDVIRNLSGMWQLLFPERYVRYLDLPQTLDPATAVPFFRADLASLRDDFARLSGRDVTDEAIQESIRLYNGLRERVRRLYALRGERPDRAPASEVFLMLRAGDTLPPEQHAELVDRYLETVMKLDRPELDLSRVVVTGAFCEQPPLELVRTLERAGCGIVDDDLALSTRWISEPIREEGDPLEALAEAYLGASVPNATHFAAHKTRGDALVARVRELHADGVVFCAPSFCDPALLERPMLAEALDRAEIPYTSFKYAENMGQFHVIREQAGTFSDAVKLWSEP